MVGRAGAVHIKISPSEPLTVEVAKMLAMTFSSAFDPPKVRVPSASSMATASMLAAAAKEIAPSAISVEIASSAEVALIEVTPREDRGLEAMGVIPKDIGWVSPKLKCLKIT